MKFTIITASVSIGLLIAHSTSTFAQEPTGSSTSRASPATQPDNSKSNKTDETNRQKTAEDQSNSSTDVELTRKIRQSVTGDASLSTYAHNVKIVTVNGHVTLNGVVKSATEKDAVEKKAMDIAGKAKVTSELKVTPGS